MITRILVPVDGSKAARKAVQYATELSKQTKAPLTVLSVIDKGAFVVQAIPADVAPTHLMAPIEDYLRQAAEAHVKEAEKICRKRRIKVQGVVRSGHPVEEILKEARRSRASLIIVGSHGKGAVETAVLGSVTFGLIHRNTKFPVLVIR